MTFVICVLYHPGDAWRDRLWGYCRARWEQLGIPITEGRSPRGLFAARNAAAKAAGRWDAAIFADADIALVDPEQARAALERAAATGRSYVAAFTELVALGQHATEEVLGGGALNTVEPERRYHGSWVGAYAISRALFDDIGGYDERFAPYSGQDVAIIHAAVTLGQLERVPGTAVHLWHERGGAQPGHPPSHPVLLERYTAATGDPVAMRELLRR